ncbi:MAG: hypothetical protein U9O56_03465 [Campylobacterota bacterium]|nr:hypothetical protein [Campylobacterota bacterium]
MNDEIIKRLNIIKQLIEIDDSETIDFQIEKLLKLDLYNHLDEIIINLNELNYDDAIESINNYLNQEITEEKYTLAELNLKKELKDLEKILQELSQQKLEYENDINEFHIAYNLELGDLLEEILELEEQKSQKELKEARELYKKDNTTSDDFDKAQDDYNTAKEERENFSSEHDDIKEACKNTPDLNNNDKKLLKQLYRKACKLCHPDIVTGELKDKATEIMKTLNEANSNKDIEGVKKILENLENGTILDITSDKIDDPELLEKQIATYREKTGSIQVEIDEIKEDETFILIQEIEDFDKYFIQMKKELQEVIERLKRELDEF